MIFVGQVTGNSELIGDALKGALDVDPTNERFYLDWMSTVEPRWGGSLPEMAEVARAAELHVQANPLLRLVSEKQRAYLGVIEMQNDNYPAALAAFEQALVLAPSTVDLELAGEMAGKVGDHEKAIWFYSESFRFDRGQGASTLAKRAWELKQIGLTALAAQDLENVAALASSDEDTLYQQAWAYFARHDYAQAEKTYLKILQRNPRNESALLDLVKMYAGLDQAANAKPLVARLQKLYPTVAETWLATASVICNEDKDGCRAALNRYLELADGKDPDEKQKIETARFQLEQLGKQPVPAKG
jgi:tetratricopeptide (TPR) repeat protein